MEQKHHLTRDTKLRAYLKERNIPLDSLEANSIAEGVEWADAHPVNPWHKVSEGLPKKGGHYLCMDENKHIVELAFCGTKWVNTSQFIDIDLCLVKYWMSIPELPKED